MIKFPAHLRKYEMSTDKPLKPYYVADRSHARKYGYTIRDVNGLTTWFTGPNCTGGWYKIKTNAQHCADVLNRSINEVVNNKL